MAVDPQEFGEVRATVIATAKALDTHVVECSETNKTVARNLERVAKNHDRLLVAVGALAALMLGKDGLLGLLAKLMGP